MNDLIAFALLLIVAGLLERILKGSQKGKSARRPAERSGVEEAGPGVVPRSIEEILVEELGLNLERRPTVRGPADREAASGIPEPTATIRGQILRHPAQLEPSRPRGEMAGRTAAGTRQPVRERIEVEERARRREAAERQRVDTALRRAEQARRRPERMGQLPDRFVETLPSEVPPTPGRPRRSEGGERFPERYGARQPAASREPLRERSVEAAGLAVGAMITGVARQRRARLPGRRDWSELKRAIVWSELIGPPKALSD